MTTEILEGLRRRTDGEVKVLGLDPWTDYTELHRLIGVIPQDFRFSRRSRSRSLCSRKCFHWRRVSRRLNIWSGPLA